VDAKALLAEVELKKRPSASGAASGVKAAFLDCCGARQRSRRSFLDEPTTVSIPVAAAFWE